jgi:hypothetical protein
MTINLTDAQSDLINNSPSTHDYMTEYKAEAHGDEDHSDYFTAQFEADTSVLSRSRANDVGGIIIYMKRKQLVAYFDYENLCGTVFQ